MLSRLLVPAAFLLACYSTAQASPATDAFAHFDAVASGNVERIMQDYAPDAVLLWIGGPLDGAYHADRGAVRELWQRFAAGQAAPLKVTIANTEVSENFQGATVTANVEFVGRAKVRYVLVYRQGKLVGEIWQYDPTLNVGY